MRWVIGVLAVLALAPRAFAADIDVLRGSTDTVGAGLFTRWSGFYAGGQFGLSNLQSDFSAATQPLVAFSLRELALENEAHVSQFPVLGQSNATGMTFGAYAGYNTQWQDLILGLELGYTFVNLNTIAPDTPIARRVGAGGTVYDVNLSGSGSLRLIDFTSLRAQAGWVVGNFLPYGFAGFALGRADYSVSTSVFAHQNPDCTLGPSCNPPNVAVTFPNSNAANNALLYGFTVGGGLQFALTPNIFVRGEYEYVRFAPLNNILVSMMSGRLGAGVKF